MKKSKPRARFANEAEREKHRLGISRRRHYRCFVANFGPASICSTLTFDKEHTANGFPEARRVRDNYCRSLKRACPDAVIFLYMGRDLTENRIHFHMVSEGVPPEIITGKWRDGEVSSMSRLGEAQDRKYWDLACCLFDHWTPEQGGHRWKQSRNRTAAYPRCTHEAN